jgi:hypothetical protein
MGTALAVRVAEAVISRLPVPSQVPAALLRFPHRQLRQITLGCAEPFSGFLRPYVQGIPGAQYNCAPTRFPLEAR